MSAWPALKKRMPNAQGYTYADYNGKRVIAVFTLRGPHSYIAQPVELFDTRTLEWVGSGWL